MSIDEIAQNIVSSYRSGNNEMLRQETMKMIHQINFDESMFAVVKRPCLVAKSLYFMLTQDYLSKEEQIAAIKLTYFNLLSNYLKNSESKQGEEGYEDLVVGSKLAIVLISMQNQYLMYSVVAGLAGYINPQTHMRNQVLLFGGIAKEAELANCDFPLEDVIVKYFVDIITEINDHLPTGKELAILKEKCFPVIKSIRTGISINLKEPSWMEDI